MFQPAMLVYGSVTHVRDGNVPDVPIVHRGFSRSAHPVVLVAHEDPNLAKLRETKPRPCHGKAPVSSLFLSFMTQFIAVTSSKVCT